VIVIAILLSIAALLAITFTSTILTSTRRRRP
jgi:hypothetical protein